MSMMFLGHQFKLTEDFKQAVYHMNTLLNPHYDWNDPKNIKVQNDIKEYDAAFENGDLETLKRFEREALKGQDGYAIGVKVEDSPWGDNTVLEAHIGPLGADEDIVKKEITVKPGFMLSLQRHRGREETWSVPKTYLNENGEEIENGILTLISDGERIEVQPGDSITLPKGNVHCMINTHNKPVRVIETQKGTCREADNVRLVDFNNRPTVPLLTWVEGKSAILYAKIHAEIKAKFGCEHEPNQAFTTPEYTTAINTLKAA